MSDKKYSQMIGVIDQGTSSSRFVLFSAITGEVIGKHQIEIEREHPQSGWVQQSANDIYKSALNCMNAVSKNLRDMNVPFKVVLSFKLIAIFCRILLRLALPTKERRQSPGTQRMVHLFVRRSFGLIQEPLSSYKIISIRHPRRINTHSRYALDFSN